MRAGGFPFLVPMLLLSLAFFVTPLALLFANSLGGADGTFTNYTEFLGDSFTLNVLLRTLRLGVIVVVGATLLGIPIALLYWHAGPRWRQLVIFLTLLPMLTSNIVRTFAWIVILGREGLISETLMWLGLTDTPTRLLFTETGVALALIQIELPLLVLPLLAVLSRLDRRLTEAAEVSGAGRWRTFLTVLLPLSLPGLIAGWILVFASATTSIVTQTAIGGARNVYLPQLIYREVGTLFNWPLAAAIAVILLIATGTVMLTLAALSRHRRLVAHG
ncbi:MAG: ABC transporter permease [Bauldia sp.]